MTSLILPDPPPEPVGPEPAQPIAAPEPPPEPVAADTPPPEPDMFPRDYVEELRREAAGYRTRAKQFEEAFDGYDEETRDSLLEYFRLAPLAEAGDAQAAARIQEMFGGDDEDASAQVPLLDAAPEPVDYRAIAREEAANFYAEQERQRAEADGIAAVRKAGEDLGYAFGSEDYILFVRGANEAANSGSDDPIAAGDAAVKAYHQSIVDAFLGQKSSQADHTAQVPTGAGAAPNLAQKPWTDDMSEAQKFAAAARSAEERFRAAQSS